MGLLPRVLLARIYGVRRDRYEMTTILGSGGRGYQGSTYISHRARARKRHGRGFGDCVGLALVGERCGLGTVGCVVRLDDSRPDSPVAPGWRRCDHGG